MTAMNYKVTIDTPDPVELSGEPINWCKDNIGNRKDLWEVKLCAPEIYQDTFLFVRGEDAMMFKLRWS